MTKDVYYKILFTQFTLHSLCNSKIVKKNGTLNKKQLYKCYFCGRQFRGGARIHPSQLWQEYTAGKQTYNQLAKKYNCSSKTIQRKIDTVKTHRKSTCSV